MYDCFIKFFWKILITLPVTKVLLGVFGLTNFKLVFLNMFNLYLPGGSWHNLETIDDRESFTLLRFVYNLVLKHFDRSTANIDAFANFANAQVSDIGHHKGTLSQNH
jgi:hypothetical protein